MADNKDYLEHEEMYKGCRIRLLHPSDGAPEADPREHDNVGEMVYTSSRYVLGDRRVDSWERFFGEIK